MCERCVIEVNKVKKAGIKINKIFYSNNNGTLTSTTPIKLLNRSDHHITKFFKNNNYKPHLGCEHSDSCDEDFDEDIEAA